MKPPKSCLGFNVKDAYLAGWKHLARYNVARIDCFPAIPTSEVERDYVHKGKMKEMNKSDKKFEASIRKWAEQLEDNYIHKDKIKEAIKKFPDELREYLIKELGLK